ncbi:hypothetical protein Tco_0508840 [Tanacetum coccineum]
MVTYTVVSCLFEDGSGIVHHRLIHTGPEEPAVATPTGLCAKLINTRNMCWSNLEEGARGGRLRKPDGGSADLPCLLGMMMMMWEDEDEEEGICTQLGDSVPSVFTLQLPIDPGIRDRFRADYGFVGYYVDYRGSDDESEESRVRDTRGLSIAVIVDTQDRQTQIYQSVETLCHVITYYGSGAKCIDFRITVSKSQETGGDLRVMGIRPQEAGPVD